ncbi:hypothetical protein VPH35_057862 [Triticum aestivum]
MIRRSSRRRGICMTDDDDLLREILLRLPPGPSSLPRASAVCKRWRGLVTDPRFLRRFYAHHGKPPLIGVFDVRGRDRVAFRAILGRPDDIPPRRFDLRRHRVGTYTRSSTQLLECRHGRVLLMDYERTELVVCAPMVGEQRPVPVPPDFMRVLVICAAGELGHMHDCHMGNLITTTDRCELVAANPGILVGDALYWSPRSVDDSGIPFFNLDGVTDNIIEFDLDRQSLAVIKGPPGLNESRNHQIIQAENGAVGLAILSHGRVEMWQRKVSCHGGATWLLHKTVEMHTDNGVMFLYAAPYIYMVPLMSMQPRRLYLSYYTNKCHPFTSFYAPAIRGGCDGAEMLQDT